MSTTLVPTSVAARRLPLIVGLAVAGFGFQQVSMNALLPALQRTFDATTAWSTWIMTAFLLVGAVSAPLIGRLGDQRGRGRVLGASLAVFALAGIGAACAPNLGVLIGFRALAGVSGAFLAIGIALIGENLPRERVAGAVAGVAASLAVGNVVAALLAPQISQAISWRAVFVVGALLPLAALWLLRGTDFRATPGITTRIDVPGAALLGIAIASLMLALTEGNSWGWSSAPTALLLAVSLIAGGWWIWVELHVEDPVVDLRMLMQRTVLLTNLTIALAGAGMFAGLVLMARLVAAPLGVPPGQAGLVDYGFGASTVDVGLLLFAQMAVAVVASLALGPFSRRYGWKPPLVISLAGLALALAMLGRWHDHMWQIVVAMMVMGISSPLSTIGAKLVGDDVQASHRGVTGGLNMVAYYIGGVIGTQGAAAILEGRSIPGTTVPSGGAYTTSFYVLAIIVFAAIPFALMVQASGSSAEEQRLAGATVAGADGP